MNSLFRRSSGRDDLPLGFAIFGYSFVAILALICFVPFWLLVVGSFTSDSAILTYGFRFWPAEFTLDGSFQR